MRKFAEEVSQLAHSIGKMDVIAVKVASENGSMEAQRTCAQTANGLYDVMLEKAASDLDALCFLLGFVRRVEMRGTYAPGLFERGMDISFEPPRAGQRPLGLGDE